MHPRSCTKDRGRLLIINPNISESATDLIASEARRVTSRDMAITALTAPFGVAYIETRFEALIGTHATATLAAEHIAGYDALIVAALVIRAWLAFARSWMFPWSA